MADDIFTQVHQEAQAQPQGDVFSQLHADTQAPAPQSWTNSVGDFASSLWKQINPIAGAKGAAQLTSHPIDTLKSDADTRQQIYRNAEDSFKKGNYAEGAAHLLHSFIPLVGPQLDAAANDFVQGNYAKGAGASIGLGLSLAAPEVLKNANISLPGAGAAEDLSKKMYQSSLKPPPRTFSEPQVQSMVQTGLENEIPISSAGRAKLNGLVSDLNDSVRAKIQAGQNAGVTVNKFKVASRLGQTAQDFSTQVNPGADLANVSKAGNEFLETQPTNISALNAQDLKSGTYKQLGSKAYGELESSSVEAQKALARGIKEELQVQFPEIQGLNAKEGKLLGLDQVLEGAVNRTRNNNMLSLGGKVAGAGVAGAKGGLGGAAVGAGTAFLHDAILNPEVQSKLAIAINKASKGNITMNAAKARVMAYANTLGNAVANPPSSNTDASQGGQ